MKTPLLFSEIGMVQSIEGKLLTVLVIEYLKNCEKDGCDEYGLPPKFSRRIHVAACSSIRTSFSVPAALDNAATAACGRSGFFRAPR